MTVTVSQQPTYQLPNQQWFLTFSATVGNFVRIMVTGAPESSGYAQKMLDQETSELEIGNAATGQVWLGFEPDVPGVYTLKVYELTVGASGYGGYFSTDTDGYASETVEGSTNLTFYAGQRLESDVGTPADAATLVLHVWNATVRPTTRELHGEDSPALIDPTSPKAETFVADSSVVAALAAMENVAATTVAASASAVYANIYAKFAAHLTQASVHYANDTDNTPASGLGEPTNEEQLVTAVATLQRLMRQHFENDPGDGTGAGAGSYHGATDVADGPLAPPPSDYASAIFAMADMWRAYETHRAKGSSVHNAADSTNTLTALTTGSILALCKELSDVLVTPTPTAPSTDHSGATVLVHRAGMTRA